MLCDVRVNKVSLGGVILLKEKELPEYTGSSYFSIRCLIWCSPSLGTPSSWLSVTTPTYSVVSLIKAGQRLYLNWSVQELYTAFS